MDELLDVTGILFMLVVSLYSAQEGKLLIGKTRWLLRCYFFIRISIMIAQVYVPNSKLNYRL